MKKGLIYWAITYRKVTILTVFVLLIFGFYSYYLIPKQESPDVAPPVALITTVYPGASPEDVEKLVVAEIEEAVKEIEGYDYCTGNSKNSLAIVIVYLKNEADTEKAWDELRQKMDDLQDELPEECYPIEIDTELAETAAMMISLSGENYTYEELCNYAEMIKKLLVKVDGISRIEIMGKQEKEIKVIIDHKKINYYNLSLEDVSQILKMQNIEIPSGAIEDGVTKINVSTPALYTSLSEIKNTILQVSEENNGVVRVKDIATVKWDWEDDASKIRYMGKNAILLNGYFDDNLNIVLVGKEVEKVLGNIKEKFPDDLLIDNVLFQPHDVSRSVNSFILNLIEGVILVIIVVLIGMSLRNALIVSTAIPLSILVTFLAMYFFKIKIHEISTAGLIIALGMLVDNAIVVSDAIQVKIDSKLEKLQACIEGAKESAVPILTSTLTTIIAFTPLMLISGAAGEYVYSIPVTVIFATSASYLIAMLVTPTMAYMFLKERSTKREKQPYIHNLFHLLLEKGINHKKMTFLIILAIFLFSIFLNSQLGLVFFPNADKDIIYLNLTSEFANNLDKTEVLVSEVEGILKEQKEIISYISCIGDGLPKFYITVMKSTKSPDFAQIMARVDFSDSDRFKNKEEFANYLQEVIDEKICGGTVTVKLLEQSQPIGARVKLRVSGSDMDSLVAASEKIKEVIKKIPGTINVRDDAQDKVYEYQVNVDTDRASQIGISKIDVQKQLNIALKGYKASVFRKEGNNYNIVVKSNINSLTALENLGIKSSITNKKVLLKQIAEVELIPQRPILLKYDGDKAVTIMSDVKPNYNAVELENLLEFEKIPELDIDYVDITFDGEREQIKENFGNAGKFGIMAILLIYFILVIQFNSFSKPLVILVTIPLSVTGSILGLFLLRQSMSFTALLGIISLFGVVVNNAILLIEHITLVEKKGATVVEAVKAAVERRFKPIILSTITTVMGLVPLALSGSSLFVPMAISLLSGLLIATFLTLVVIPLVYILREELLCKFRDKSLLFKSEK